MLAHTHTNVRAQQTWGGVGPSDRVPGIAVKRPEPQAPSHLNTRSTRSPHDKRLALSPPSRLPSSRPLALPVLVCASIRALPPHTHIRYINCRPIYLNPSLDTYKPTFAAGPSLCVTSIHPSITHTLYDSLPPEGDPIPPDQRGRGKRCNRQQPECAPLDTRHTQRCYVKKSLDVAEQQTANGLAQEHASPIRPTHVPHPHGSQRLLFFSCRRFCPAVLEQLYVRRQVTISGYGGTSRDLVSPEHGRGHQQHCRQGKLRKYGNGVNLHTRPLGHDLLAARTYENGVDVLPHYGGRDGEPPRDQDAA
mmetsp:Transcript_24881/g.61527  ORF Transcript_24881/g.61527 Transcript_24881/m.61527 type:complete len:306 (+) Transcript_24881:119-1036(+)